MIGLDTCAIIDLFKGNENLAKLIKSLSEPLAVTQLSYIELIFGINYENPKHKIEQDYYDALFQEVAHFSLDTFSIQQASRFSWDLKKKGKTTEQFDCLLCAILLTNGVSKIITKNTKHFENIPGIKPILY